MATRLDRLRNRREWSLAGWALATHIAIWLIVNAGLLVINLATGAPPFWFLYPLWGWGMLVAAHAGYLIFPRGLLGTTIGVYLVLNLGLMVIDLVHSSTHWFYWPLLILGVAVLIHIGAVVTLRLREQEVMIADQAGSVATPRRVSETSRIIMGVLLALSLILAVAEFGTGAINGISIRGSGQAKTITRSLAPFSKIVVRNQGKLFIELGPTPSVTIKGDDNIVGRVETTVSGSTLTIQPDRTWYYDIYPKVDLEYHVTVPSLTGITLYDQANADLGPLQTSDLALTVRDQAHLTIDRLAVPNLSIYARDNANVTIAGGTVNQTTIKAADNADLNLSGLVSQRVTVTTTDNADVMVLAAHALDAESHDNSAIRYSGAPSVITRQDSYDNSHIGAAQP